MPSRSSSAWLEPVGTATSSWPSFGTVSVTVPAALLPLVGRTSPDGAWSSGEFSPRSVPAVSTSAGFSSAEAVSVSGSTGSAASARAESRISRTATFRLLNTLRQYTSLLPFTGNIASLRIDGLIEDFAAHLSDDPNTSPRTAEFYEADLREFARFLDEKNITDVEDVGVGSVMEFRNRLLGERRKRFTVYRKDAAVRRFLDWVRTSTDAGLDFDPIEPMHQPLDQQITFLEDDEAAQLLSFPVRERDDARDAAVIRLMLDTGVTVSEIRGLLRTDLDLEAAQVHLGGPGSHLAPRTLRLPMETVEAVRRYLEMRDDETPELIVGRAARPVATSKSLQNAIWKRCEEVGMWRVSPMVLRHTFAIRLLRRGATLNELKEALGVRDTSNIGVYKKFV